jgi:alkylation response protein AidB-like acyl-CoA dehydrogenase
MDFGWGEEEASEHERALRFAREKIGQRVEGPFDRDRWRALGEFGFLGLSVPPEFGGLGLGALRTAHLVEALGQGAQDRGLVFSAMAHLFACAMPLAEGGSEEQKRRYLPLLCSGEWVGANAITEAEAGSDVFAMKTRAIPDGDDYLITGSKSYVTNGPEADLFLVYAVTNPAHGFMGVSAFLVERATPGLTVGRPFDKTGLSGSPIAPIYLEAARVPAAARLGPEGRGGSGFKRSMHWERACLFAAYVGAMEDLLGRCVDHARTRRQFGRPLGKNQAISHRLVDMKLRLESARLLLYRACWELDRGRDGTLEVSMSKLAISEAAVRAGLEAVQIFGGMGYMTETGVEQFLRDALPTTLFSGTSEIQRDIIASRMGL